MFGTSFHCFPATRAGKNNASPSLLSDLDSVNQQCWRLGVAEEEGEAGTSKSHRV